MMDGAEIARLHDECVRRWHDEESPTAPETDRLSELIVGNHRANFDLWHEEDKARDPVAPDAEIARVKRAIDRLNQRRNDVVEAVDDLLLQAAPEGENEAPLHSETPGMMIDRMSILALKIFHTREQTERTDATEDHRARNRRRLETLERQRSDLAGCLTALWREVCGGRRRIKVYRQMKMYNDPELNPAIYGRRGTGAIQVPSTQGVLTGRQTLRIKPRRELE